MLRHLFNRVLSPDKDSDSTRIKSGAIPSPKFATEMAQDPLLYVNENLAKVLKSHPDRHLQNVCNQVFKEIFTVPLFTSIATQNILDDLCRHEANLSPPDQVNTQRQQIPRDLIHVQDVGFLPFVNALVETVIGPVVYSCFPHIRPFPICVSNSYFIRLVAGGSEIGFHTDDSDITVNICLGGNFEGSVQYFQGPRCKHHLHTWHRPEEYFEYAHEPGSVLLYTGNHRHGVYPIRSGYRTNLVILLRTVGSVQEQGCPEWCGEHENSLYVNPK